MCSKSATLMQLHIQHPLSRIPAVATAASHAYKNTNNSRYQLSITTGCHIWQCRKLRAATCQAFWRNASAGMVSDTRQKSRPHCGMPLTICRSVL
jgi:hypothetical protein